MVIGRNGTELYSTKRLCNSASRQTYTLRLLLHALQGLSLGVVATLSLGGCSIDISQTAASESSKNISVNRKNPDFINGEIVKTSAGHQITGVFGEVLENTKSFNNSQWEFEGVFYE